VFNGTHRTNEHAVKLNTNIKHRRPHMIADRSEFKSELMPYNIIFKSQ